LFGLIADADPLAQLAVPLPAGSGAAGATQAPDSYPYSTASAAASRGAAAPNSAATDSATATNGAAAATTATGMSTPAAPAAMTAAAAAAAGRLCRGRSRLPACRCPQNRADRAHKLGVLP
jgi:hypothetical protein